MFRTETSKPAQEEGFTLAGLIVILTIISIIIAFTVPEQWSLVMGRERDRQTIFLMKQYARGIMAWQTKHSNTAPVSLEQLQDARKPRMLRGTGKWPCPLTGSDEDWILVPPNALMPANAPQSGGPLQGSNDPRRTQTPSNQPVPGPDGRIPMKLNKELSPKDYVGPFVAVRPNASGTSFMALNGIEDYSEWVYTVDDLRAEIARRQAALNSR